MSFFIAQERERVRERKKERERERVSVWHLSKATLEMCGTRFLLHLQKKITITHFD